MKGYIDVDSYIKYLDKIRKGKIGNYSFEEAAFLSGEIKRIEEFKVEEDVVKIVRCDKCKNGLLQNDLLQNDLLQDDNTVYCSKMKSLFTKEHFCAYGIERKDKND